MMRILRAGAGSCGSFGEGMSGWLDGLTSKTYYCYWLVKETLVVLLLVLESINKTNKVCKSARKSSGCD